MPPLKPAGSIIDLTLDEFDNTRATPPKAHARALTADSSIEILDALPLVQVKPRSKKRARTPTLQELDNSARKRRKTDTIRPAVAPSTSIIELLEDDEFTPSTSMMHNAVASSSRRTLQDPLTIMDGELAILSQTITVSGNATYDKADWASTSLLNDEDLARRLAEEEAASHAADEELARRIMEEEKQQYLASLPRNTEDEALARQLYEQEQREQERLRKAVDAKQEGIVYRVSVNIDDGTLEDGSPAHPDDLARFEPWRQKLESCPGVRVKRFHWIVNYELEKKFEGAREILTIITGETPQEQHLFHGTRKANIDSILSTGFRIGGIGNHKVINGTAHGTGVYLATTATMSMQYAPDADRIFACRVLPGRTTPNIMRDVPPSTVPGSEEFESYCGPGGIYVVRYSTLVLPCYMIEFERAGYGAGHIGRPLGFGVTPSGPIMPTSGVAPVLPPFRVGGPPAGVPLYPPGYTMPMAIPRSLAPAPRSRKGKGRLR